ncbi:hypothetical protein ACQR1W_36955 [Bradyrhizobium sp. HKCCYLS1011]|uniref:hypothetical protein n=1 Tax=Bradyrhizobium sp. HKCCYLS1011 TaxID=3420733 RepID=UPI003EB9900B
MAAIMMQPVPSGAANCAGGPMLTVKDSQDGFAGKTGTIWTINGDCSYEVAQFRGAEINAPHRRGQLTPEQQAELAKVLAAAGLNSLPSQIGDIPPVNAHQLSIEYQGRTIVLSLGMGNEAPDAKSGPAQRVIEVSNAVRAVTGDQ